MSALLEVQGIGSGYGDVPVLSDVSLSVGADEIVSVVGANGAGKTTLLSTISGLLPCTAGTIRFDGEAIERLAAHDVVTRGVAQVPEGRRLFKTMNVRDNLLMGAYRVPGSAAVKELERVYSLFPILSERRNQPAGTMSGGEQQMCAIGRALMSNPKLLLIDELSLGLAPRVVDMLADTLLEIRNLGISILLVEQDVTVAFELSARGYLLDTGRIVVAAPTAELAEHPKVRSSYLGA